MRSRNRYDGTDPTIIQSAQVQARRLFHANIFPDMEIEDIEQEFVLHVLRRIPNFDAARASFPTFIDRVIRNRAAALIETAQTQKRGFGTKIILFSDLETSSETAAESLADRLGAGQDLWDRSDLVPETEDAAMLRHDLSRLLDNLPQNLWQCCHWLLEDSVGNVSRRSGLARGTIHSRVKTLRRRCHEFGLKEYFGTRPALSKSSR
jgi:RNA polymerase sigma-70 factor, ECF subfamily